MAIRIGISGWRYARWRGTFYPAGLAQRRELEYAAGCFPSVEINGSFYSLQRPESFQRWHDETPDDFVFSVKGPRFITHMKRLRDCDQALANFFASGVLRLGAKLGPILWQLPPTLRFDADLLDAFLSSLPRDSEVALALAHKRDTALMQGRSALAIDHQRPIRHALEVRHDSFCDLACMRLLRRHNVAVIVADTAGKFPYLEDVSADFVYLRLHGDAQLYASGYSDSALDRWAARIAAWASGGEPDDAARVGAPARKRASRDVYCYFDNDMKVHAPFDARGLMQRLQLPTDCPPREGT
ncbi:DUF72 domain-containing protein [Xanthomonas vasicola]|uniref:Uncharacterized protein n=1 Tax=Xanthomonas vasicola pv. vasculorum NCPPB 890 TaxID=1184265 RepID=A0A836P499_XANVA|nr:DUF72 domain-containing protein [Xanthomonas vasicola]KFA18803.1 hypothetical protein KWS_0125000 [Xanthomonas vasicola pv. musacearum NCPPB 4384]AZR30391.1 DUF72 domain-containing protein [Xanthomonas vasicola pv. musacearum NCPPB 4379]KFA10469.1 hypothetical protein KWM_0108710 [Xanthomonas vasicola pv. musacearum NCPPB 2005]KFA14549.1 hypothetical protein KWQ_0104105 [Xanthomonas vasicola pv. musacearum NCPPB 4380]KFA19363.1 hypothetical protein A11G_0108140 [Xanthomonas vasicola pv. mus